MVQVFKTSVEQPSHAALLLELLSQTFPLSESNFDLEDCDRILRVQGVDISDEKIIEVINVSGFYCEVLH